VTTVPPPAPRQRTGPPPLPPSWRRKPQPARAAKPPRFLRHKDLAKFRNLLFAARVLVEGLYSGRHKSPLRGSSPEFVEYRRYAPGDPTTAIDWKAFARTDRYYIKVTEKETDMDCHLLVDASASMEYTGSNLRGQSKLEYASLLAAALSYLIVRQGDKVGLTLFNDKIAAHLPAGGSFPHLYRMLKTLESGRPQGETEISAALRMAFGLFRRKGLLVVLSDFYDDPTALFRSLSLYTHRNFEVVLFHVLHEEEYHLPAVSQARFVDAESGARITCNTADLRRLYDENLRVFIQTLRAGARARRIDYEFVHTGMPYDHALRRYLALRHAART
jgi:uncharacterized protein (DUF58 family)